MKEKDYQVNAIQWVTFKLAWDAERDNALVGYMRLKNELQELRAFLMDLKLIPEGREAPVCKVLQLM